MSLYRTEKTLHFRNRKRDKASKTILTKDEPVSSLPKARKRRSQNHRAQSLRERRRYEGILAFELAECNHGSNRSANSEKESGTLLIDLKGSSARDKNKSDDRKRTAHHEDQK